MVARTLVVVEFARLSRCLPVRAGDSQFLEVVRVDLGFRKTHPHILSARHNDRLHSELNNAVTSAHSIRSARSRNHAVLLPRHASSGQTLACLSTRGTGC